MQPIIYTIANLKKSALNETVVLNICFYVTYWILLIKESFGVKIKEKKLIFKFVYMQPTIHPKFIFVNKFNQKFHKNTLRLIQNHLILINQSLEFKHKKIKPIFIITYMQPTAHSTKKSIFQGSETSINTPSWLKY